MRSTKAPYYEGSLNHRNELPSDVKKAYVTYKNQKTRCFNNKVRSYRDYGAKGIVVEYSVREFVGWYLKVIKNKKLKDPVVGRINHSKNYSFSNIELIERSENSSEAMDRCSSRFSYPVIVKKTIDGTVVSIEKSIKLASIKYGNSFSTVHRQCNNKTKNIRTNYTYNFGGKS